MSKSLRGRWGAKNNKMPLLLQNRFKAFYTQWEIPQARTREDEDQVFEDFANFYVLGRQGLYPSSYDAFSTHCAPGESDYGIDGIIIVVNGVVCETIETFTGLFQNVGQLDVEIHFLQAKNNSCTSLADILKFTSGVKMFLGDMDLGPSDNLPMDAHERLHDLHEIYSEIINSPRLSVLPTVKMWWVAANKKTIDENKDVDSRAFSDISKFPVNCPVERVEIKFIGSEALTSIFDEQLGKNECEFDFVNRTTFPDIDSEMNGSDIEQAFVGVVPISEFLKIIAPNGKMDSRIFDENVRDFVGENDVNKDMRETLMDPCSRSTFAYRNNGVTIVAEKVIAPRNHCRLENYQIVNGCQTSNVIFQVFGSSADIPGDVLVPIRVIGTRSDAILDLIVMSTNSQTAIDRKDLNARSQVARELERFCDAQRESDRVFFERRQGQFDREKSVVKTRVLCRVDFTKAFAACILRKPYLAIGYSYRFEAGDESIWDSSNKYPVELFYISGYLLSRIDFFLRNKKIDKKYSSTKLHLISAVFRKVWPEFDYLWEKFCNETSDSKVGEFEGLIANQNIVKKCSSNEEFLSYLSDGIAAIDAIEKEMNNSNGRITRAQAKKKDFDAKFFDMLKKIGNS
jgi:hypothetical protein